MTIKQTDAYSIASREDALDFMTGYSEYGEQRWYTNAVGAEQVSFSWRRMLPGTGGRGSYGHRHRTQEEIYFVASGELLFKLEDEVIEVPAGSVVRIAPQVVRSVWNDGPDDAVLIMCSIKSDDPEGDHETVPDFWPE